MLLGGLRVLVNVTNRNPVGGGRLRSSRLGAIQWLLEQSQRSLQDLHAIDGCFDVYILVVGVLANLVEDDETACGDIIAATPPTSSPPRTPPPQSTGGLDELMRQLTIFIDELPEPALEREEAAVTGEQNDGPAPPTQDSADAALQREEESPADDPRTSEQTVASAYLALLISHMSFHHPTVVQAVLVCAREFNIRSTCTCTGMVGGNGVCCRGDRI